MTAAATARARPAAGDRLAAWCGWVMVGAAVLIPLLAWLAPLGFAPLLAVMGLLCLPSFRITDEDRPVLIVLLGALIWAAASTTWSPTHAKSFDRSVILQLALALPLFWSAVCGARRADPRLNDRALRILGFGLALFGAELIAETFVNAGIYRWLHERYYEPIRIDLARMNVGHSTFVLALLWPAVLVGGLRRRWEVALLTVGVAGAVWAAHVFNDDAPVLALPVSAVVMLACWMWPRGGPRMLAAGAAALSLLMPAIVWVARASGVYDQVEPHIDPSWTARLNYWSHTLDWVLQKPAAGWGLDASRSMGGGISLHPHNGALQIWLELGLIGAVGAAAFWGLGLLRLSRQRPSVEMSGVAGSVAAFLLFAWINYGVWQGWWLALGALIPVMAAMLENRDMGKST